MIVTPDALHAYVLVAVRVVRQAEDPERAGECLFRRIAAPPHSNEGVVGWRLDELVQRDPAVRHSRALQPPQLAPRLAAVQAQFQRHPLLSAEIVPPLGGEATA